MADPNYVYQPWSQERRERASRVGKERWARKQAGLPMAKSISADEFIDQVKAALKASYALDEQMEEMACAQRYFARMFPERADDIEAVVVPLLRQINWE